MRHGGFSGDRHNWHNPYSSVGYAATSNLRAVLPVGSKLDFRGERAVAHPQDIRGIFQRADIMKHKAKGFSLVEFVIVVLIIALLAALTAPRFMRATATAKETSARQSLAVIRDAIELYVAEHHGSLPIRPETDLLAYLRGNTFPECSIGGFALPQAAQVAICEGDAGRFCADPQPSKAWKYNRASGKFIINSSQTAVMDAARYDAW